MESLDLWRRKELHNPHLNLNIARMYHSKCGSETPTLTFLRRQSALENGKLLLSGSIYAKLCARVGSKLLLEKSLRKAANLVTS